MLHPNSMQTTQHRRHPAADDILGETSASFSKSQPTVEGGGAGGVLEKVLQFPPLTLFGP
jgi:hypothetical protein